MSKILFVGGPKDGKREMLPPNNGGVIQAPVFRGTPADYPTDLSMSVAVDVHTYHLQRFNDGNGNIFEVAFHSGIANPMAALIKGYRYHRKNYGRRR